MSSNFVDDKLNGAYLSIIIGVPMILIGLALLLFGLLNVYFVFRGADPMLLFLLVLSLLCVIGSIGSFFRTLVPRVDMAQSRALVIRRSLVCGLVGYTVLFFGALSEGAIIVGLILAIILVAIAVLYIATPKGTLTSKSSRTATPPAV